MKNNLSHPEETIEKFYVYLDRAIIIKIGYLLLIFILQALRVYSAPDAVFIAIALMSLMSLVIGIWFERFSVRISTIINVLFVSTLLDLLLITVLVYYLSGIDFIYYTFYIMLSFIVFPRAQAIIITFWTAFLFLGLIIFRSFHMIPAPPPVFPVEQQTFYNFQYVSTTLATIILTFVFLGYFSYGFYKMMAKRLVLLKRTQKTLEEEGSSLEIKVQARKRALALERKSLTDRVKERKEGLEEQRIELEKRARELEKFQKAASGREMKMSALKKEIEKFERKT